MTRILSGRAVIVLSLTGALAPAVALGRAAPTSGQTTAPTAQTVAGGLVGVTVRVRDLKQALRFWHDGLGLAVGMQMGPPDRRKTILTFADPRQGNVLLLSDETGKPQAPLVPGTLYYQLVLRMPDLSAVASRLKSLGFTADEPKTGANGYRTMIVTTSDGGRLELVELPSGKK